MTYREVLGSVSAQKIRSPGPANEVNWKSSMLFCQTLSDAIDTYGSNDLPNNFFGVIEPYVNSILECAVSERTQLSVQACKVAGNLAKVLGKDMHPLLDRVLPILIKHCASTKAVNQKSAAAAISTIIVQSTYSPRLLWHICQAFIEKNVGPRLQAPGWLLLIIQEYPQSLVADRDVESVGNSIFLGLVDADNNVRTKSRALFWEYHKIDPEGAEQIKGRLNNHAVTALDNDPHNPDQKSAKPKPKAKQPARPDSALAQMRKQAKQRLQEHAIASKQNTQVASSVTSANFTFGELEIDEPAPETRGKKPSRDVPTTSQRSANNNLQPDNHHIAKPASRPIAIHKKGSSNDGQVQHLNKKLSAMDINNHTIEKKTSHAEGLRTSQNKKPTSSANTSESSGHRSLLSGPVRRPRIVATPMNVPNTSSRPSSRTGQQQQTTSTHEHTAKHAKETGLHAHSTYQTDDNISISPSDFPQPLQQIKASRKATRQELSSPVVIPDGKENANIFPNSKSWAMPDGTPTASHIQRVLDYATNVAETAQQYLDQRDAESAAAAAATDSELKNARKALGTALGLMQSGQMDYMGFRKLKNIICSHGPELIVDEDQYNALFGQLLPRLGSITELVHRGDPRDMKHPTYVRQAILHMILTLLKQYHPTWSGEWMGPSLSAMMLARCAYSRNAREFIGETEIAGQPHLQINTTVEVIMDSMREIIVICQSPLDVLETVLECLGAAEAYLIEHAEELEPSFSVNSTWRKAYASFDRYSKEERLKADHIQQLFVSGATEYVAPNHLINLDGFKDTGPELPSKMPFLMETALKLITPLLMKARSIGHNLYPMQEEMLGSLGQHLLTTYNALIRRQVMPFCEQLFLSYTSESKFWENFPEESDRNLLHYYLADVKH